MSSMESDSANPQEALEHQVSDSPEGVVWGFWMTLLWGLLVMVAFALTQGIVMGVLIALMYMDESNQDMEALLEELQYDGFILTACTTATGTLCTALVFGLAAIKSGWRMNDYLGFRRVPWKSVGLWSLAFAFLLLATDLTSLALGRPIVPDVMLDVYGSVDNPWFLIFAIVIGAPLFEEVFFRGFLFPGWQRSFIGLWGTIVVTALLWAVIHLQYDAYGVGIIFVMGLFLGLVRHKTNSIVLCLALHALANAIASAQCHYFSTMS